MIQAKGIDAMLTWAREYPVVDKSIVGTLVCIMQDFYGVCNTHLKGTSSPGPPRRQVFTERAEGLNSGHVDIIGNNDP
jgi:hypothetical protein